MKMKKAVKWVLLVCLCGCLISCGSSDDSADNARGGETETTEEVNATEEAEEEKEETEEETETVQETEEIVTTEEGTENAFEWPTEGLGAMLPDPGLPIGNVLENSDEGFEIAVGPISKENFTEYAELCRDEYGFNVDYASGTNDNGYSFLRGYNDEGWLFGVIYVDDDSSGMNYMVICLVNPSEEETTAAEPEEASEPETEENTTAEEAMEAETEAASSDEEMVDGMRVSFKEAMDSFEAFFDEYLEFMENYDATDTSMLMEYLELLSQYSDTMSKFEDWESEEMNDVEAAYYAEVSLRIAEKTLEATAALGDN